MSTGGDHAEAVLRLTSELAAERFGPRFVASYAIGSLAHGGFTRLVSDVDCALVITDPVGATDAEVVVEIAERVRGLGGLAERLSLFWSSPELLTGAGSAGRIARLYVHGESEFEVIFVPYTPSVSPNDPCDPDSGQACPEKASQPPQ